MVGNVLYLLFLQSEVRVQFCLCVVFMLLNLDWRPEHVHCSTFEFLRRPDRPVRPVFKYRWSIEYLNSTSWVYICTFYYSGRAQDPRCDRYFRTSNFILLWAYNVVNYYDADVFVDIDFFPTVDILNTMQGSESLCMISHNDIHLQEPDLEYVR